MKQKKRLQHQRPLTPVIGQVFHYLAVTNYEFAVLKAQLKSEWGGELRIITKHYFIERKDVEEDINYFISLLLRFEIFTYKVARL